MAIEKPIFGMHVGTETDAKLIPIQGSIDKTFPHLDYFSYLLGVKVESGVGDNPYGIGETLLGGIQRTINMEQKIPVALQGEDVPDIIKQIELEGKTRAVDLGSVESGVIPTVGAYSSIFILRIQGRLTPDMINQQNNTIQLPKDVFIQEINPTTHKATRVSIDASPFAPQDLAIRPGDEQALYPDRAIGVIYDPKTDTMLIGISEGVLFDREDVRKTIIEDGGKKRVAENMRERLILEGKLTSEGRVIRDGIITDEIFDVQNPQRYINPELPREKQIGNMTNILIAEVKRGWETMQTL